MRVIDYDIEGYEGHLCAVPQGEGKAEEAVVWTYVTEENTSRVEELSKVIDDHLDKVRNIEPKESV